MPLAFLRLIHHLDHHSEDTPGQQTEKVITMASVHKDGKGWKISYVDPDGNRRSMRPGKVNKTTANQIAHHVQSMVAAKASGGTIELTTAKWLGDIGDGLHKKLANAKLVDSREPVEPEPEAEKKSLAEALAYHIQRGRTSKGRTASSGTILKWQATAKHLNDFFGDRAIDTITVEDAEQFRDWLGEKTIKRTGKPYSENNIRSVIASAKMFFNAAKRRKWVTDSAFENEVSGTQENKERSVHVNRETAELILKACPDTQWKLMFALWRLAALRKMEIFALRWEHVLWDECLMVVPSSKTAHHTGCEERIVPIAEILPYLEAAFNEASEGTQRVITRYDESNSNLDKPFRQIVLNAGVTPWAKAFQNLRASCETAWLDWVGPNGERNSAHVVASWVGHSIKVQNKHYAQVDRHHFKQFNSAVLKSGNTGGNKDPRNDENTSEVATVVATSNPSKNADSQRFYYSNGYGKVTRPGLEANFAPLELRWFDVDKSLQ